MSDALARAMLPLEEIERDVVVKFERALITRTGVSVAVRGPLLDDEARAFAKAVRDGRITIEEA